VIGAAGYSPSQYRIVQMGYPAVTPRGADNRYSETGLSRLAIGGCPMWNKDMTWARDDLVVQLNNRVRSVTAVDGVQFLDLRDAFAGRGVCAKTTSLVTASVAPSETRSEWGRFLVTGTTQGVLQESFHPNAYGQRALGRCLTLMWAASGDHMCRNTPGLGVNAMTLTPLTDPPLPYPGP
jgi:hypothetical protein